ncbi:MAG: nucleocapsid protein [Wufeng shrew rhabdovirus 7]|nr:MAG: nucleocapsid protein [Wufeng shrew rhabdovirus 7]
MPKFEITEELFDTVSNLESVTERQQPYKPESWADVTFHARREDQDLIWVPHYIIHYQNMDPPLSVVHNLASLCSRAPDDTVFPEDKLLPNIKKVVPEPPPSWNPAQVKDLFTSPLSDLGDKIPGLRSEPSIQKASLATVIAAYGGSPPTKIKELSITLEQLHQTAFAALYLLPRASKKFEEAEGEVSKLVEKASQINPSIEPAFLQYLLDVFWKQPRWKIFLSDGSPIITNVAICGLLFNEVLPGTSLLKAELSFAMLGIMYHAFTSYQLLLQVAKRDKRKSGEVLRRIPTASSDNLMETIIERKEFMKQKPCWYSIAPICNPEVRADFSLSRQPAISKTFVLILEWLDKDQSSSLAKLILALSSREIKEAEYGFQCYKKCLELETVGATREVRLGDQVVDLNVELPPGYSGQDKKKKPKRRGKKKKQETESETESTSSPSEEENPLLSKYKL